MKRRFGIDRWPVLGTIVEVSSDTYTSWREDRTLRLGAGLAFYALFTIVPFFALTVALAEQLFGLIDMAGYLSDRLAQVGIVEAETAGESIASRAEPPIGDLDVRESSASDPCCLRRRWSSWRSSTRSTPSGTCRCGAGCGTRSGGVSCPSSWCSSRVSC